MPFSTDLDDLPSTVLGMWVTDRCWPRARGKMFPARRAEPGNWRTADWPAPGKCPGRAAVAGYLARHGAHGPAGRRWGMRNRARNGGPAQVNILHVLDHRAEIGVLGEDDQDFVFLLPGSVHRQGRQLYVGAFFLSATRYGVQRPALGAHDVAAQGAPTGSTYEVVVAEPRTLMPNAEVAQLVQPFTRYVEFCCSLADLSGSAITTTASLTESTPTRPPHAWLSGQRGIGRGRRPMAPSRREAVIPSVYQYETAYPTTCPPYKKVNPAGGRCLFQTRR